MSKKTLYTLPIVIILLIVAGVLIGMSLSGDKGDAAVSKYSAVYLDTGDIYFGEFSRYPHPTLTNVWYVQRNVDENNQPQVGIAPFRGAFWGPDDEVRINEDSIVMVTRLRGDSEVVKVLDDPAAAAAAPSGAAPATGVTSTAPAAPATTPTAE